MDYELIARSLSCLDVWLDTMLQPEGYAGPVTHIWRSNLIYCGPLYDWRYEGIIKGYLELYNKTQNSKWLDKAKGAAGDIVSNQFAGGTFRNSQFEYGANTGGTPHEAAIDIALLATAKQLRAINDPDWRLFFECAAINIERYHLGVLWTGRYFRNSDRIRFYVPNKCATVLEALLLYSDLLSLEGDRIRSTKMMDYAVQTAEAIIRLQQSHGGISQGSRPAGRICHTFYTARCIRPLLNLYKITSDTKYLSACEKASNFLTSMTNNGGGFYCVSYPDGTKGKYPIMIAGSAEILHAIYSLVGEFDNLTKGKLQWLLSNQDSCGGFRASNGLDSIGRNKRFAKEFDFRDVMHVCGWNDKVLYLLAHIIPQDTTIPEASTERCEVFCRFMRRKALYVEDEDKILVTDEKSREPLFKWWKKEVWSLFKL